jgi:hypothetical protein
MDKFNNSNSSLALQKFYNQQNHDIRILELQQRLKTEKLMCQIEMSKLINEEKGEEQNQLVSEEKVELKVIFEESNTVFEEQVEEQVEEALIEESLGEIYYRSNENFEIDKPVTLERTKSTIINQVKINN